MFLIFVKVKGVLICHMVDRNTPIKAIYMFLLTNKGSHKEFNHIVMFSRFVI